MRNQIHDNEAPFAADIFKIVPVVRIDGKSTQVPVQLMEEARPTPACGGKVLHIVMSNNAVCAWRSN